MIIKTYEEKYLDEIILMIKECILEINQEDYSKKQVSVWADIDLDDFKESIPKNAQFILANENIVIGYGDMTDSGYLDRLFVHKNWQRQGVAKLLLQFLESNCSSKTLSTYSSITAKPFFESQGYKVIKENEAVLRGEVFLNYYMEKCNT